jgi:hypothetical protein
MLCVPTGSVLVAHAAVLLFPVPANAIAEQPVIVAPPAANVTVPVGAVPTTVAVNVTVEPNVDGAAELASVVVDGAAAVLTPCDSAALVDARLLASPI